MTYNDTTKKLVGYGWGADSITGGTNNLGSGIGWVQFYDVDFTSPVPPISASCSPTAVPSPATTLSTVTWSLGTITGGTAPFTYVWSGDDVAGDHALNSTSTSASKIYSSAGTKTASVTITDKNLVAKTISCATSITIIVEPPRPPLSGGVCTATPATVAVGITGNNVVLTAAPYCGGVPCSVPTSSYRYSWSRVQGEDVYCGPTGSVNSCTTTGPYSTVSPVVGDKKSRVTITDPTNPANTTTADCSATATQDETPTTIAGATGICPVSKASFLGKPITYTIGVTPATGATMVGCSWTDTGTKSQDSCDPLTFASTTQTKAITLISTYPTKGWKYPVLTVKSVDSSNNKDLPDSILSDCMANVKDPNTNPEEN